MPNDALTQAMLRNESCFCVGRIQRLYLVCQDNGTSYIPSINVYPKKKTQHVPFQCSPLIVQFLYIESVDIQIEVVTKKNEKNKNDKTPTTQIDYGPTNSVIDTISTT